MKRLVFFLSMVLGLVACQRDPSRTNAEMQGADTVAEPQLIQAADGTLYSKSCLQENAAQIQAQGTSAMSACQMKITLNTSASSGEVSRNRFFHWNSYAWIFYPPTYCNPQNNYSSNLFCGYVFGGSYNFNCYALFGYTNTQTYSTYYNPSCNSCLYSPNPTYCQNTCYGYKYFHTY